MVFGASFVGATLLLSAFSIAGMRANLANGIEENVFSIVGCREEGQCVCNVHSDWTMMHEYQLLKDVFARLNKAENILKMMNFTEIYDLLENFTARLQNLEDYINNQTVDVTVTELFELKRHLHILTDLVRHTNAGQHEQTTLTELKAELAAARHLSADLWERNPHSQQERMNSQLADLREQISRCEEHLPASFFKGDTLPLQFNFGDWCDTHEVEGFGDVITQRWLSGGGSARSKYRMGAWYKDPIPLTESQRSEIWYRLGYDQTTRYFLKYPTYSDFVLARGRSAFKPVSTHGTGSLIYRGALFYYYRDKIYKHNVTTGQLQSKPMIHTPTSYSYNAMSHVTFQADERGLWVLNSKTDDGILAISWVDPETLVLGPTWTTNITKQNISGAFMICGKLYTYVSHNQRLPRGGLHEYTKQTVFDIDANQQFVQAYDVTSLYGFLGQVTYNPRERLLFGWDNQHLVNIGVLWKHKHPRDGIHETTNNYG